LTELLDIHSFDKDQILRVDPLLSEVSPVKCHHDDTGSHDEKCRPKFHNNSVGTVCLEITASVDLSQLIAWLASLFWEQKFETQIFRVKGLAAVEGKDEKYMIQGVHDNFDVTPTDIMWEKSETRHNKIVFIGRKLDLALLQKDFCDCLLQNSNS